ncbi:MAG: ribosome rescue protein RqcH [Sulfolobus sp.]
MSYIDLLAWLTENKKIIEGCRIDNVFKVEGTERTYLLRLYSHGDYRLLVLEPAKRIHFTKYDRQKSSIGEVILLRELLKDRIIKEVEILGKERIVKFTLSDSKKIYLELLPRGLLVITDQNDKILYSSEYKEFKDRVIKAGLQYTPPPSPSLQLSEIEKLISKGNVSRILGLPQEIIEALGISVKNKDELEIAKRKVEEFINRVSSGDFAKCLLKGITVLPVKVDNCIEYSSYNDALDDYFTEEEKVEIKSEMDKKLEEEKKKIEKTIKEVEEQLEEYRENEELNRKIAELIISNYQLIEDKIRSTGNTKNSITVTINDIKIEIDPKLNVYKNASKYYDIAKEYSEKAKKAEETLRSLKEKLSELNVQIEERKEEIKLSTRKKEWYEKYHWSFTRNGFLVIAGRDVDQNESLVRKLLEDKDIFLHADIHGAAATILKTNGLTPSEDDIRDAAVISACYSKAWKAGMASIDIYWVYGSQVSKSPPSGEYLKKGSFMIYGKKNYIKNVKLELAIGLEIGQDFRILVGSEDSVKTRTDNYVIIVPGDEDPSKLADKIIKQLSSKNNIKGLKVFKEDLIRSLPGKSRILMKKNKSS